MGNKCHADVLITFITILLRCRQLINYAIYVCKSDKGQMGRLGEVIHVKLPTVTDLKGVDDED